jgi:hypothetical protein
MGVGDAPVFSRDVDGPMQPDDPESRKRHSPQAGEEKPWIAPEFLRRRARRLEQGAI